MAKTVTAPEMTDGQIENAVNKLRDAMRKHRSEILPDVAQLVLGVENLGMMMFTPFRERAEAVSNLIVRTAKVNRSRSPQEAIDATGRTQYTDRKVVDAMSKGEDDEVEVVFFKPDLSNRNGFISDDDLEKEFELRGLKPVDPYSLAAVNEADPAFADDKPHGTHWKDENGQWCCATFRRWSGGRHVSVDRYALSGAAIGGSLAGASRFWALAAGSFLDPLALAFGPLHFGAGAFFFWLKKAQALFLHEVEPRGERVLQINQFAHRSLWPSWPGILATQ